MSAFFVYHARTRPTGRLLASALGIEHGRAAQASRLGGGDVLIRWGTQERITGTWDTVINSTGAAALASDKLRALQRFEEHEVPHPEFTTDLIMEPDSVWLGRLRHGFGGRDIQVWHNLTVGDLYYAEFYTKFIPNDREYRIHVYNGRVIRVQRKYLDHPEQKGSEYIKNFANGYRFRQPSRRLNASRLEVATRAVEALGLTFGAVDLIVDHEGKEYVLEVNTAPKCSPLTASKYVEAMRNHLRELGVGVNGGS